MTVQGSTLLSDICNNTGISIHEYPWGAVQNSSQDCLTVEGGDGLVRIHSIYWYLRGLERDGFLIIEPISPSKEEEIIINPNQNSTNNNAKICSIVSDYFRSLFVSFNSCSISLI